ncbi:hypothetical protein HZ994_05320 [Akkermansiaceae bacterium]|nr:hypothetical protein HZ994_05320 [Akkermansiaceae bacterium]
MAREISCERIRPTPQGKRDPVSRLRSVPHRQPFVRAVIISAMHYMGIIAAATTLTVYLFQPSPLATKVLVATLGYTAATWLVAFFKRRNTHCPLCKGTPLINSGALPHKKAFRLYPFNQGVSATLSIIATQKFRCMYCGTGFDILKEPSHLRGKEAQGYSYENTYSADEKP